MKLSVNEIKAAISAIETACFDENKVLNKGEFSCEAAVNIQEFLTDLDSCREKLELLLSEARKPARIGFVVTIEKRLQDHASIIEETKFVTAPVGTVQSEVEAVALNMVSQRQLERAPESEGDNVFMDDDDVAYANLFWVTNVDSVPCEDVSAVARHVATWEYEALVKDGQTLEYL